VLDWVKPGLELIHDFFERTGTTLVDIAAPLAAVVAVLSRVAGTSTHRAGDTSPAVSATVPLGTTMRTWIVLVW
jgi:hypothetical protein